MESAYEECLCYELKQKKVAFQRQVSLPLTYKETVLDCGYCIDLLVDGQVILELKTVERLLPIHEAQLLTYLKLTGCKVGLLMNFNVSTMKAGIKRLVYEFRDN